jgi:hypothetical protein
MPKVLISYRRADSAGIVGRIYERLVQWAGPEAIFLDVDNIPEGIDFHAHLQRELHNTDALLCIIGRHWLGPAGQNRLRATDDAVRIEIETALEAGVTIVPILADGGALPPPDELPEKIRPLRSLNALAISSGINFNHEMARLISALSRILGPKAPAVSRAYFVRNFFSSPWFSLVVLAAFSPIVAATMGLGPPWPRGAQYIAVFLNGVALLAAVQIMRLATRVVVSRTIITAATVLTCSAIIYMLLQTVFVFETPVTGERWAKGFVCTREARQLYAKKCPFLDHDELRGAEYEAERLWTRPSIAIIQVSLALAWFATFLGCTIAVVAAVSSLVFPKNMRTES